MKESDIRPKELIEKLEVFLQKDRNRWLVGQEHFIRVPCPACGSMEIKDPVVVRGMTFETCTHCETVFYNPRPTREQLRDYYAKAESYTFWAKHIFPKTESARRENIFHPLADKIATYLSQNNVETDVLMEIGAGSGIFCDEIKRKGIFKRIIAVEPTPDLAQKCRGKELEVIEAPFEELDLPEESINCIVSFEVIEHVFSPRELVQKSIYLLKKNGLLVLKCPNVTGFDFMVLGRQKAPNFGLEHINMFNTQSLAILLEKSGFTVLDVTTPGELDADIVRNQALEGKFDIIEHPFLKRVLIDEWERLGNAFQRFLADNLLSSSMLAVAQKR